MSYSKKLCQQMCNLVSTVSNRFPEDKKLSLACTALETLKNHNNRKLTSFYISQIYLKETKYGHFRELVKNRNTEFFLTDKDVLGKKGTEFAQNMNLGNNKEEIDIFIENLREHWRELSEGERNAIWSYFDVLNLLAQKYLEQTISVNATQH